MAVEEFNRGEVAETILSRFRCSGCGYGASRRDEPERCPMCGGRTWEQDGWPGYAQVAAEAWADLWIGRDLLR